MSQERAETTRRWYEDYYGKRGNDRNDVLHNPEVLFQTAARDLALTRALRRAAIDALTARVLDVGCGDGITLAWLMRIGFPQRNLVGIDIIQDRIDEGKARFPGLDFRVEDAGSLSFNSASFDVVLESTLFATLTDDELSRRIAREMWRVVTPKGAIILVDWRVKNPLSRTHSRLGRRRVEELFPHTRLLAIERGALIPPVGRYLSSHLPSIYFLAQRAAPFLVGQVVYLLQATQEPPGS